MASFSTKGIWIDLLCYMWDAPERGELTGTKDQLRRLIGANEHDFGLFLSEAKSLSFCYFCVTGELLVTVRNRRMYRDARDSENNRLRQARYRDKHKSNAEVTHPSSSSSPSPTPKKIKNIGEKRRSPIFTPPTLQDVSDYCKERKNNITPEQFLDYYASKGWMIGQNKMKDWKAAIRTWERNEFSSGKTYNPRTDADEILDRCLRGEA